jgi:DNA polymerase-1
MIRLLIDGDIVAYKAATSAEIPVNWGEGLWTLHCWEDDVKARVDEQITKLMEAPVTTHLIAFTDKHNYRKDIAPYYKLNRKEVRKPMLLNWAKEYMNQEYNVEIWKGLEADDVLGILGSQNKDNIIWSADKDLLTIPANHWIDGEVVTITEEEADYQFYYQTLVGDTTDNYKGCPSVGAVKAKKILEGNCTWEAVVNTFKAQGLSEEVALENARLARILRDGEYNRETGEVKLWSPKK